MTIDFFVALSVVTSAAGRHGNSPNEKSSKEARPNFKNNKQKAIIVNLAN